MLTLMLVGGFYVQNVPDALSWLKYLSFMFYGYQIALHIEFHGRTYYDCMGEARVPEPENNPRCTRIDSIEDALELPFNPI